MRLLFGEIFCLFLPSHKKNRPQMKKLFFSLLTLIVLGLAGCDKDSDNPICLKGYEKPVFFWGASKTTVRIEAPYILLSVNELAIYFIGTGIVEQYVYLFDGGVYSCGAIVLEAHTESLKDFLSRKYVFQEYTEGMYVYMNADQTLQIGLYPIGGGLIAVEYMPNEPNEAEAGNASVSAKATSRTLGHLRQIPE